MKSKVTAEEFVRAWQESANIGEVMKRTGLQRSEANNRASHFRRKGVSLKKMKSGPVVPDYAALDKLARSLVNGQEEAS